MAWPLDPPWRHLRRWPAIMGGTFRRFERRARRDRGRHVSWAAGILAVVAVVGGALVGTLRIAANGHGWVTLTDPRRRAVTLLRAVLVVAAGIGIGTALALVTDAVWILGVIAWTAIAVGGLIVAAGGILAATRPPGHAPQRVIRTPGAVVLGDLTTRPGEPPSTVIDLAAAVAAWADDQDRELRAEAVSRRAAQYVTFFEFTPLGTRRSFLEGDVEVLHRMPRPRHTA